MDKQRRKHSLEFKTEAVHGVKAMIKPAQNPS